MFILAPEWLAIVKGFVKTSACSGVGMLIYFCKNSSFYMLSMDTDMVTDTNMLINKKSGYGRGGNKAKIFFIHFIW